MRFITEFELDGNIDTKLLPHLIPDKKGIREMGIGKDIGRAFGWDNYVSTTLSGPVKEHFKLEIEAFPMDKWVEFRQRFFDALPYFDATSKIRLENALRDLESFCKPSGDAMTNLFDQMEYRGSSSHCKACEDEAAGIKHILAQKHTCKK